MSLDRNFSLHNVQFRKVLAQLDGRFVSGANGVSRPLAENAEEKKYKHKNYNGLFHKGFAHDLVTGALLDEKTYEAYRNAIVQNDQLALVEVPMAAGSTGRLVDPLASLASVTVGIAPVLLSIPPAAPLASIRAAAEQVELYAQMLARDIPFTQYTAGNLALAAIIAHMNDPTIRANLPDSPIGGATLFTPQTIFRGLSDGNLVGPHISQLWWLNVPQGGLTTEQKFLVPMSKADAIVAGKVVEWGRNNTETALIQNVTLSTLPPTEPMTTKYVFSGRSLAESVHADPPFQFPYNAALILASLGIQARAGWPVRTTPNQGDFVTNTGQSAVLSDIAAVSSLALKHVWWHKWQRIRRLRPEAFGLWVDNVKNGRVDNKENYDIHNALLNSPILDDAKAANAQWGGAFAQSYTLSQTYREGSPLHPACPSGHAVIGGACCTVLKIIYNTDIPWSALPGVQAGPGYNRRVIPLPVTAAVCEANDDGSALRNYVGADANLITVNGEIDKLAFNLGMGRDWAGIHYRSDIAQGCTLGEKVAISYMTDQLNSYVQNQVVVGSNAQQKLVVPSITFTRFNGQLYTLRPTIRRC